jgi:hypothetical protein
MAIDLFYKSCIKTDFSLHHVTFIEPLTVFPTEAMSFDSEQFTNNSINKVVKSKPEDLFLLLEEHFTATVLIYRKPYEVQFEDLTYENFEFFS